MKSTLRVAALAAVLFLVATVAGAASPTWTPAGNMSIERRDHTATLLANGKVLIEGGSTTAADLFDPASNTFTPTGNTVYEHGPGSTATRLLDGRVLVVGGRDARAGAELYDPATGTFSATGSLNAPRLFHTATRLADGRVLIAGGAGTSAELYDPATGTFSPTGNMTVARAGQTSTLLPDGRVLLAGGDSPTASGCLSSAEVYNPTTATFTPVGSMHAPRCSRWWTGAPLLPSGKVLIVGALNDASAELFDPATQTFSLTGSMTTPRAGATATLLPDGRVLVAGGVATAVPVTLSSAELYDPASGTFSPTASMAQTRWAHTATLLQDGRVLVTGGSGAAGPAQDTTHLKSAELFTLAANHPPRCDEVALDRDTLWPPNHKLVRITAAGARDDDAGDTVTLVVDTVTQDEPTNGTGDGDTAPDAVLSAPPSASVWIRAERSATGDGRVYRLGFTATDSHGATCSGTRTVSVPKSDASGQEAVDLTPPGYDSTGQ